MGHYHLMRAEPVTLPSTPYPEQHFPVKFSLARRKVITEIAPELADRLKLDEKNQQAVFFTLAELKIIKAKARTASREVSNGFKRNSLWLVMDITNEAIKLHKGIGAIPASERIFQFKITLKDTRPPIWRRIQVKNCTLGKLHEHIQTAMGWSNSHLHDFKINDKSYGDPRLLEENFLEFLCRNSTTTKVSDIVPQSGKLFRFRYRYDYDFGNNWHHDVLFEGVFRANPGQRYPVCLEGARSCPQRTLAG